MRIIVLTAALVAGPVAAQSLAAQSTSGPPTAVIVRGPEEGRRAPDFTLPWANKDGIGAPEEPFALWKTAGKPVVLAFYPKDFTSGCTAELTTFTEQYQELFGPDVVVVAISADSLTTHQRFAASINMPFMLLSDPDQKVAKLYGSNDANGYNRRTVYVIGKDGKVAFRNMKFGALDPKAYAELKEAVKRARG